MQRRRLSHGALAATLTVIKFAPGPVGAPDPGSGIYVRQGGSIRVCASSLHRQLRWGQLPRVPEGWRGSMAAQKIEKSEWRVFFDWLSKGLVGARAEIEVASLAFGEQTEAHRLPGLGLPSEPKNDVVELALEGAAHFIKRPKEVWVGAGAGEFLS